MSGHAEAHHGDTPGTAAPATAAHADAAHAATTAPTQQNPATSRKIKQLTDEFNTELQDTYTRAKARVSQWMESKQEKVEEKSLIKTPFHVVGDVINGTIVNGIKRVAEIALATKNAVEAAVNTVVDPFAHPFKTLFHPIKYLANPLRVVTSTARAVENTLLALPRAINDGYQGVIQNPTERAAFKLDKVPLIGGIISTVSTKVSRAVGWIAKGPRMALDWVTSPIDMADESLAGLQNA